MKKFYKIIAFLMLLFIPFSVCGCTETTVTVDESTTLESTTSIFDTIKFEDKEVTYDGKYYNIEVENMPTGATVRYSTSKKQKDAGEYDYTATVTYNGVRKEYTATLTIKKADLELTFDDQTLYLNDGYGTCNLVYSVNFNSAQLNISKETFDEAGTYTVTISADESKNFNALSEKSVNVTIKTSRTGYSLISETKVIDSENTSAETVVQAIDEGASLEGYTVSYTNNVQTEQGIYQVKAEVKDASGELYETYRSIFTVDYPTNESFKEYSEEMFVYLMEGDQSTINIFFVHPENYGFDHYDAEWYTYEEYTQEEFESDLAEIQRLRNEYNTYKDARISLSQKQDLRLIDENITLYERLIQSPSVVLMRQTYVDQYGGYAADFPTTLEAYSFRTIQDIEDALSYVESAYTALMSYMDYIKDREEAGYTFNGFTLNGMAEYLEGVAKYTDTEEYGDYYLINIYNQKLDACKESLGLTDAEVTSYKEDFKDAFNNKFLTAHKDLAEAIREYMSLKNKSASEVYTYLYSYEGGKELYAEMLKNRLGLKETTMEELIEYMDTYLEKYLSAFMSASYRLGSKAENIIDGKVKVIDSNDFDDIYAFLKEFAKTIVPDLETEPTISVTEMDSTVTENTTTLAYYMKSPIDSFDAEYIHINANALGDNYYDTILTLAHEGYPGHLYAYVYTKEQDDLSPLATLMTCTGHGEGWAKYVEIALSNYIADIKGDVAWSQAAEYNNYYSLMAYLLQSRIDIGVNYEGWTISQVGTYLGNMGLNSSIAEDIFNSCNEAATQIIPYGYGASLFYEWHQYAKTVLGSYYNEIEFNTAILEHGWCSLDTLEIYLNQYLSNQAFLHNLSYTER